MENPRSINRLILVTLAAIAVGVIAAIIFHLKSN
jgi:hypothetical protein